MLGPDQDTLQPQAPNRTAFLLIGPNIISWCIQLIMYGFSLSMFCQYRFTTLWDDISPNLGRLMTAVVCLNTISTGLNFQEIVHYGTSQKRDYGGLAGWTLADCFPGLSAALIGLLVETYLAHRCLQLVRNRTAKLVLCVLFFVSITVACVGSIGNSVCGFFYYAQQSEKLGGFQINVTMAMYAVATAFCDTLVTITLYATLSSEIRGFSKRSDSIVRYLLRLSLRTAAYTAVFAFVGAVLALRFNFTSDYSGLCFLFLFCLPSLATLSLFTTIDGTMMLRAAARHVHPNSTTAFSFGGFRRPGLRDTEQTGPNAVSVNLETVKVVDTETRTPIPSRNSTHLGSEKDEEKMV